MKTIKLTLAVIPSHPNFKKGSGIRESECFILTTATPHKDQHKYCLWPTDPTFQRKGEADPTFHGKGEQVFTDFSGQISTRLTLVCQLNLTNYIQYQITTTIRK